MGPLAFAPYGLTRSSKDDSREIAGTISEIAHKIRQYLGITLLTSLLTGVTSALWAFAIGLELPLVWGVLNFVPVVGNFAGILPPSLYGLIQFKSLSWPLIALERGYQSTAKQKDMDKDGKLKIVGTR